MRSISRLAFIIAMGISLLAAQVPVASAATQVCLLLTLNGHIAGSGPMTVKLGVMDYGNGHYSVAGSEQHTLVTFPPVTVKSMVHGNAEVVGDNIEISLNQTGIFNNSMSAASYHIVIPNSTLKGSFIMSTDTLKEDGTADVIECSR